MLGLSSIIIFRLGPSNIFPYSMLMQLMGRRNWCEVTEADEVGCEKSLKFTIWTEDPKNIGKDLQPYCCLVPPLLPGYSEVPEEEVLNLMDYFWSGV